LPLFQRIVPMMIAKTIARMSPILMPGLLELNTTEEGCESIIVAPARFVKSAGR
jgi:hypothetical protein